MQGASKTEINTLVDEAHEAYAIAISAGASRACAIEAACAFYSKRRSDFKADEIRAALALSLNLRDRVKLAADALSQDR
jgi:hypothetical protein